MNDLVAIKAGKLPAHLAKRAKTVNAFAAAAVASGFPVVSIKGKVFHVQRGDERTLITKPDSDDEPAASLEVVILASNPNKSKVYYAHGYEQGSVAKPTCYSNDGVGPAADATEPQAKKCATCPHNQWGSRITDNGGKGKACSDSIRLAIAPAGQINDPMLLRVPAATLKVLGEYGAQLAKRSFAPEYVITKIGFDYSVAHPALTFKAVRLVTEEEAEQVDEALQTEAETIGKIIGVLSDAAASSESVADAPALPAAAPVVEEEEEEEAPKPKKAAPKKAAVAEVEDFDSIDSALDSLDFDD